MGYHRAGFKVVGIDNKLQVNYPFRFFKADAIKSLKEWGTGILEEFEIKAINASPPCQHFSNMTGSRTSQARHPDLIGPVRELLAEIDVPFVIENLYEAVNAGALRGDLRLCGTQFGLPIRRHRYFEVNFPVSTPFERGLGFCNHQPEDLAFDHGAKQLESVYRDAMGCEWMSVRDSREAIPPSYTEFIGKQLLEAL